MSSRNFSEVNPLPPGWDCKYDNITGKRYYINYFTRNTSMEDPRTQQPEFIPLQEFSSNNRLGLMMGTNSLKRQQSAVDNHQTTTTTEEAVAKISAMFPTVTETHIRTLLLKYLKSVFPVVEETVLLDTLSSSDNNVHQATQTLLTMGFDKRATPPPRVCLQRQAPTSAPAHPPFTPSHNQHRMKSVEEKQNMKVRLREKHPKIAERVVSIALDSVDYDEERADQILGMADDIPAAPDTSTINYVGEEKTNKIIIEELSQTSSPRSPPSSPSGKKDKNEKHYGRSVDETGTCYRSASSQPAAGPNPTLRHGPNQVLLLVTHRPDYVAWAGSAGLAQGPDPKQRGSPSTPRGPDSLLRKGPNRSLAKGSIYSQFEGLNLGGSRGK